MILGYDCGQSVDFYKNNKCESSGSTRHLVHLQVYRGNFTEFTEIFGNIFLGSLLGESTSEKLAVIVILLATRGVHISVCTVVSHFLWFILVFFFTIWRLFFFK